MWKKILKYDRFLEKKLDLSDLKDSPARGAALVKKLKDQEDVTLDDGSVIKIDKMKDPDIDGAWVDAADAIDNITDDSGEFDIKKASDYFKNVKPKDQRTNKFRTNTYVPVFMGTDGKEHTLTDLKKDISFGSTGAGVKIREHESIQMVFLAKRMTISSSFPEPSVEVKGGKNKYSYDGIATLLNSFVGISSFEFGRVKALPAPGFKLTKEMAAYYSADQSWLSTFCNVPNLLVDQIDSKGRKILTPGGSYTIFHVSSKDSSSIPNVIFEKFKALSKTRKNEASDSEHFSRLPVPSDFQRYEKPFDRASREEIEFSKYCPADIYIVETPAINDLIRGIKSCQDIMELNMYLNDSFNDRQIIPVSLKRVGPSPRSATIIVNAEEGMSVPVFDVKAFRLSADAEKGIASKIMTDSEWKDSKGEVIKRQRNLTMDSPNTRKNSNIDAEIDGVWARHGKISLLWIRKFIEGSEFYQKLHGRIDMRIMEWQELQKLSVDELKEMLAELRRQIDSLRSEIEIDVKYDLAGRDIAGSEKKLISKIQSLQVIRALSVIDQFDEEGKEVDRIVTGMLLYALSIQNPGFSSPKYVRVI